MKKMISNKFKTALLGAAAAVVSMMPFQSAKATIGMIPQCIGTYNCGMGGAGIALGTDATSAVNNPALGGRMNNDAMLSAGWFHAEVIGILGEGANNIPNSVGKNVKQDSDAKEFANGALGVNYRLDDKWSFNISLFPGGGGATDWELSRTAAGANAGGQDRMIRLRMFMGQVSAAYKYEDDLTVGAGLIISKQDLKTDSLNNAFASASPGPVSSVDDMYGVGGQIGAVWDVSSKLSLAVNYRTEVIHQKTENYTNIFSGGLNTPQMWTLGMAYRPTTSTDLAFDVKFIPWNEVPAIGESPIATGSFGWKRQIMVSAGIQQRLFSDKLTLRAGWAYANSPVESEYVFANFLLPAVVEHHFNLGASYKLPWAATEVGFSSYFAPEVEVRDNGLGDNFSVFGKGTKTAMYQFGAQFSVAKKF